MSMGMDGGEEGMGEEGEKGKRGGEREQRAEQRACSVLLGRQLVRRRCKCSFRYA